MQLNNGHALHFEQHTRLIFRSHLFGISDQINTLIFYSRQNLTKEKSRYGPFPLSRIQVSPSSKT
jgi:hypothetical protein